jgi:SAM-dependent methyltransferase
MPNPQYDRFSEIYEVWTGSAPVTEENKRFYVEEYLATPGTVVELGIGDGRIACEAARAGKPMIGVDSSPRMLELCRRRAESEVTEGRSIWERGLVTLIEADMRDFRLPQSADLITIPFHSIGHLLSLEDKRAALAHIHTQLRPAGRLIFDAFVFDPTAIPGRGAPSLRAEYRDAKSGRDLLLWVAVRYDMARKGIRIITWTDELNAEEEVVRRQYRRLDFSWLDPEEARALLEETGYTIETVYGSFDREPFAPGTREHIWVAVKP